MSLLCEIQEAAVNSQVDISTLLRKCKVLAARLANEELGLWVDHELNGYPSIEALPNYRVLQVASYGNFVGILWAKMNNSPIPPSAVPEEYRQLVTTQYLTEPIASYSSLAQSASGEERLGVDWPADLLAYLSNELYESWTCVGAWKRIPLGSIHALLDTVRNRVLEFVLAIQAEAPLAGESRDQGSSISRDRVDQVFNTIVMGNVGSLTAGDQTITHYTQVNVGNHDFGSLRGFLSSIGVADCDIAELEESIHADAQQEPDAGIGNRTRAWLGKMVAKAGTTAWNVATSVAASLLTQALGKYFGFPI